MPRTNRVGFLLALLVLLAAVPGGLAGTAAAASETCSFPVTKTDATGTQVTVDQEPQRIVTLAPSAAQTLWEIGAKSKVVAVSTNAAYLSGTGSLSKITTYPSVDTEAVVNQTPDLVLAPDVIADDDVDKLRSSGLTVYNAPESKTIEDVYSKTLVIGRLTGECDGAQSTVSWMREEIGDARDAVRDRHHPVTFYHMGGRWTTGSGTFIHEVLRTAGATNVAAEAGISGYRVMSAEQIVRRDPAWIVRGDSPYTTVPRDQLPYSATTAVAEDQIVVVDADYIGQAAPRIVYVIEEIAEALHPDVDIDVGSGGRNADLTDREPTVSRSVSVDGSVTLAVGDLYASRDVNLSLENSPLTTTRGVRVSGIDLTLAEPNPSFEIAVTPDASLPASPPGDGKTVVLGTFAVTPNGLLATDVSEAHIHFSVPREALVDLGAGPDRVVLYRYTNGNWNRLETSLVDQDRDGFTFTARTPGTSTFAVGVPRRALAVRDATLESTQLAVGDPVAATATVHNPGVATVTVPLSLSVGGEVLATRAVTIPANASTTVKLTASVTTSGTHEVSVGSQSLGSITVQAPETEPPSPSDPESDATAAADGDRSTRTPNPETSGTETLVRETGQDGFGIGIAVLAFIGAALVATRFRGDGR